MLKKPETKQEFFAMLADAVSDREWKKIKKDMDEYRKLSRFIQTYKHIIERKWDRRDLWNYDQSFAKRFVEQLEHFNKTRHGYPMPFAYVRDISVFDLPDDEYNAKQLSEDDGLGSERFESFVNSIIKPFKEYLFLLEEGAELHNGDSEADKKNKIAWNRNKKERAEALVRFSDNIGFFWD